MADTLLNMKAFLICARTGSFSEAGRQLGIATSVVTKRVNQLEWALKTKLLNRTTRSVKLTEMGEQYLCAIRDVVGDYDNIAAGILRSPTEIEGHLRVKATALLTRTVFGRVFAEFQMKYPRITLDVIVSDHPGNPVEDGLDIQLGFFPNQYEGVVEESLHAYPRMLCASHDYIQRRGVPEHPSDLPAHDCVTFAPAGTMLFFQGPRGLITVPVRPRLISNNIDMLVLAVKNGNGIGVLSKPAAKPLIDDGSVVVLLQNYPLPTYWLRASVPQTRANLARVKVMLEHIRNALLPIPPWERD